MGEHTGAAAPAAAGTSRSDTRAGQTDGIVGRVREQATSQLNTQKDKATDGLGTVAHAFRETTNKLRSDNHDVVARYAEQAADQIERLSQRLKNKDVGELFNDAQQLARRRPALFVGGAFAVGLLGARFLKSSAQPDDEYSTSGVYSRNLTGEFGSTAGGSLGTPAYGDTTASYRTPTRGTSSTASRGRSGSQPGSSRDYPPTGER